MERTSIHSNQFIVGSVNVKDGTFSLAIRPHVHTEYKLAVGEAMRLAKVDKSKKFIVLAIAAVAYEVTPVVTNVVVEYEL